MVDLNYHLNECTADAACLASLLASYDLQQHINEPTHRAGHTLNLLITRKGELVVEGISVSDPHLSDHRAIRASLHLWKSPPVMRQATTRTDRTLDPEQFSRGLECFQQQLSQTDDVDRAVARYSAGLKDILDKHVPQMTKTVRVRPNTEWYNNEIHTAKQERRRLERQWRHTKLEVHRQMYSEQCRAVSSLIHTVRFAFYQAKIQACDGQKELFPVVRSLLCCPKSSPLPYSTSAAQVANDFLLFFTGKVQCIRYEVASEVGQDSPVVPPTS